MRWGKPNSLTSKGLQKHFGNRVARIQPMLQDHQLCEAGFRVLTACEKGGEQDAMQTGQPEGEQLTPQCAQSPQSPDHSGPAHQQVHNQLHSDPTHSSPRHQSQLNIQALPMWQPAPQAQRPCPSKQPIQIGTQLLLIQAPPTRAVCNTYALPLRANAHTQLHPLALHPPYLPSPRCTWYATDPQCCSCRWHS